MKPIEKAIELIDMFTFRCFECDYEDNAKKCAIIAVDEIINNEKKYYGNREVKYWQEVKQEIEKL